MVYSVTDVIKQAVIEYEEERFRLAVERRKAYLRLPWYRRLFPYRIKIQFIDIRGE